MSEMKFRLPHYCIVRGPLSFFWTILWVGVIMLSSIGLTVLLDKWKIITATVENFIWILVGVVWLSVIISLIFVGPSEKQNTKLTRG